MSVKLTFEFNDEDAARAFLMGRAESPESEPVTETPEKTETPVTSEKTDTDTNEDAGVDADGMPYNEDIHSSPPTKTDDGLWRARRGKAAEAKAARAEFKAAGGVETPPEDVQTRDAAPAPAAAPGAAPAPAAPEAKADAPAPVTLEVLFAAITAKMEDGTLTRDDLFGLYREVTGVEASDEDLPTAVAQVFQTNETARASMMAEIENI